MPSLMRITFTKNKGLIHTLSSHSKGKCNTISNGSASAANTINSDMPLFKVFVAEKDDNFGCNVQTLFHWGRVPQLKNMFSLQFWTFMSCTVFDWNDSKKRRPLTMQGSVTILLCC